MNKVIVIESCKQCPYSRLTTHCGTTDPCLACFRPTTYNIEEDCPQEDIPDWCPLPSVPVYSPFEDEWHRGWNACLDAIAEEVKA